ncbi:lactate/malate family dehydrogenase [Anaerovorax odorimutans]|uniref:lactate/malate family dehydrogenase n=1 Tax=Anaerovorax odorimutans TaxID=109327 RepID=UPI00042056FB|nr:hypothetical protein [Anaerovorax odorimutans]
MYYLKDIARENKFSLNKSPFLLKGKKKVNILAIGDVGGMLMTGLKLLGGDVIESIGIYDINENVLKRWDYEMNQTSYPWEYNIMPEVKILKNEQLFHCDVFIFCASKSVPAVEENISDVRMAQFEANRQIISSYAKRAKEEGFKGLFAVVSDPVDPLCKVALLEGLDASQIQGYGLGVMNSRAAYFAKRDSRFKSFLTEGRAFGPHGNDLVIANSIKNYNDEISKELTKLTVEANLKTREIGFKPFIAPALSSGAISILLTLRGEWHYSSNCIGEVYMGAKNRMTDGGVEIENLPLPELLYERIKRAYDNLKEII